MLLLACGISPGQDMLTKLHDYLEKERGVESIDFIALAMTLSHLKGLEAANEAGQEGDEYLDAFVFLGGSPDKEGYISKELLIEVIKEEFGLTIDMVEYLRKIGGEDEEITYYQFCVLLDAGTSGNPSRVSSYLSNKGASFMRFSYFINHMDKLNF